MYQKLNVSKSLGLSWPDNAREVMLMQLHNRREATGFSTIYHQIENNIHTVNYDELLQYLYPKENVDILIRRLKHDQSIDEIAAAFGVNRSIIYNKYRQSIGLLYNLVATYSPSVIDIYRRNRFASEYPGNMLDRFADAVYNASLVLHEIDSDVPVLSITTKTLIANKDLFMKIFNSLPDRVRGILKMKYEKGATIKELNQAFPSSRKIDAQYIYDLILNWAFVYVGLYSKQSVWMLYMNQWVRTWIIKRKLFDAVDFMLYISERTNIDRPSDDIIQNMKDVFARSVVLEDLRDEIRRNLL